MEQSFDTIKKWVETNNVDELAKTNLSTLTHEQRKKLIDIAYYRSCWEAASILQIGDHNIVREFEEQKQNQTGFVDQYIDATDIKSEQRVRIYKLKKASTGYFMNFLVKPSMYLVPIINRVHKPLNTGLGIEIEELDEEGKINQKSFSQFEIVMPMPYQSLHKRLENNPSTNLLFKWVLELIKGVQSLHKQGFVHRNIKPFHIQVYKVGDSETIRLGGTWSACNIGFQGTAYRSIEISAPEVPKSDDIDIVYQTSVDIYLLAFTILEILTRGEFLNSWMTNHGNEQMIVEKEFEIFSDPIEDKIFKDFILRMINNDPEKRPTIDTCYEFFKSLFVKPKFICNDLCDIFIVFHE